MMPIIQPSMRLSMSKDYVRPTKTTTDRLQSKDELKQYLKDYEEIKEEEVNFIPMGQLLRYIGYDKKNRREIFRFGGLLKKVAKDYLVLQGKNGMTFSCQRYTYDDGGNKIHNTRFFKKMNPELVLKEEYAEAMDKTEEIMKNQTSIIEKQKKELMALRKKIEEIERSSDKKSEKKKILK
jgi:hypothetical protein